MSGGLVTAPHPAAAEAGAGALAAGGSAADAAIAANAVAGVAMPHMCGIGGDLFALLDAGDGAGPVAVNASGPAAGRVDPDRLHAAGGMPRRGPAAVTVPGAVDGWRLLHERFGRLPWADLLAPAVALADGGVAMTAKAREWVLPERPALAADPESARVFLGDGEVPAVGESTRFPDLARSLERIAVDGPRVMYEGELGRRIAARTEVDPDGLEAADLARYEARTVPLARARVGGRELVTVPPNSQGATMLILLGLLEQESLPPGSGPWCEAFLRAKRAAFRVRDEELARAERLDRGIDPGEIAALGERGAAGPAPLATDLRGDTIALAARDVDGGTCVLIQSVYWSFGSAVTVPGTGIVLQNRGAYFATAPGHPNRIGPRRRTLHTLMPALVYDRDGTLRAALATAGGDGQAQVIAQILSRHFAGAGLEEAIAAPRLLHGRYRADEPDGDAVHAEDNFGAEALAAIEAAGHRLRTHRWPACRMGNACAIAIDAAGLAGAASDPRSDGVVMAVPG
ncbi:MAG: gamma-glutamyltransferase [Actinobacteria bacterium]|nr:gamma-glutamyltransferase [Actinomycetota bacterium]